LKKSVPPKQTESTASTPVTGPAQDPGSIPAPPPSSPRRRWLFRVVALGIVPLLLLGAVEIGLRLGGYGYPTHFFLPYQINGQSVRIENQKFGWRFFPPRAARSPGPTVISAVKPPGTCRIFILGESAAYGDPDPDYGFGRILEVLLRERYPETRFEVVNAAMTAINSHVILPIARDCARQQGDFWLVYMGNNEVVGPFGAGTVFGSQAPGMGFIRANIALRSFRLGQWLEAVRRRLVDPQSSRRSWGGMEMFVNNQRRQDDPVMMKVYAHFQRNLAEIVRLGTESGAKVIVSTMASNLRDCAPFASLHRLGLKESERAEFDREYQAGVAAQAGGQWQQAIEAFRRAAKVDDHYADLQFRWGQCCWSRGEFAEAKQHFVSARDADALRFRADSWINEVIRQTTTHEAIRQAAAHREGAGIWFWDAAEGLAAKSEHDVPGDELFYEHVHLRFSGNYWLARMAADQMARGWPAAVTSKAVGTNWLSAEAVASELAYTDVSRYEIEEQVRQRLEFAPFTQQLNHLEQYQKVKNEAERLRDLLTPAVLKASVAEGQSAVAKAPDDWRLRENLGKLLQKAGDLTGVVAQWRKAVELIPHNAEAHYQLGMALDQIGQSQAAMDQFKLALGLDPNLAEALNGLGLALANLGRYPEAITQFEAALRLKPDFAGAHVNLGLAFSHLGKIEEAKAQYRRALQLKPNHVAAYINLGKILNSEGKVSEAATNYAQAVNANPDDALAHFNYANTLRLLGQMPQAAQHYAAAARIDPNFAEAHCQLGFEYARQNNDAEALREFAEAIRLKPDYSEAHLNLGVALIKQQKIEEAIPHFQEALRLDPGYTTAKKYLAAAQALQRKTR
jgi:tetratricopeptide (TPR) repeat protein